MKCTEVRNAGDFANLHSMTTKVLLLRWTSVDNLSPKPADPECAGLAAYSDVGIIATIFFFGEKGLFICNPNSLYQASSRFDGFGCGHGRTVL